MPGPDLAYAALDKKTAQTSEAHVIVNGKRRLMRIHEIPQENNTTLGLAEDVTERENWKNDLKRYQATTHELLEQLRTAIGIYNADQRLDFYNSAFAQLWGLEDGWLNTKPKLGEVMEKLREERRLPEQADFPRFKQSWLDMFTGLIDPYEDMLYLPDGSALRMLVVAQSAGGLMMTFEDVTSRLELESSYNTLIAVQKETLDNLGEGVAAFGGDGRLKLWNPSYGRLWHLNPEDLESEPHISRIVEKVKNLFDDDKWDEAKEDMIAMTLDRSMREGRLSRNDGTLVDYSAVPLPDGGVLITFIDVTDSVRVENALREKNSALEAAEKLKLDFLANVSYQLRTPLSAIMGFNDILDQEYFGPLNGRQKEYTRDIQLASNRLLGLINDILDLSTIEAGYMSLDLAPVKIKDMLASLLDLTQEWARKEKIEVSIACAANIGSIEIDERRVKQALVNLIRNSIAFTPSGGSITIGAKKQSNGITLTVSDTGIGIKRENHLRIFQPFERAQRGLAHSAEKGQVGGAGLGLSLVKNIVSLHQGTVDLQSEPGKGTTVSLFIPFPEKNGDGNQEGQDCTKIKVFIANPRARF
ncbi:MAG: PAS-domain containing protein [Alphaproteobacteria bacterium]|nr:PAS-domain containing protein [Alphaproteobacteria bacterium]